MRQALIQLDRQTAIVRNHKAFEDDTMLKRGGARKTQKELDEDTTEFLWANTPNVNDDRVALWVEDTDNPALTTEAEKAAMISEEAARADGFYYPDPFGPTNLVPPSLTFTTASPGKAISCIPGTWSQDPAPTYKFQWQADGEDINQAVTSTHTVTLLDVGKVLTCVVTATNDKGSASAVSNECNAIALVARTAAQKAPAKKTPAKKTPAKKK
jgi:hypothetical protein